MKIVLDNKPDLSYIITSSTQGDIVAKANAEKLVETLMFHKKAYYSGMPVISDAAFDKIEEAFRKIDPTNPYFDTVGATVGNIRQKHTHTNSMRSLAKAQTAAEMNKWLEKINAEKSEIICSAKIDGMSGCIIYKNGKLDKIVSRGDGETGQIITHIAKGINVPKEISLKGDIEIRGEIYLPKNTKMETNGSPLRNLAVGIVNAKESGLDKIKFLHFVSYQILGSDFKKESQKIDWLKKNNFETVDYSVVTGNRAVEEYFAQYVSTFRSELQFESDGIVLTIEDNTKWDAINKNYVVSHHYFHNLAWKPLSEAAETTLISIDWQLSRSGSIIPVSVFEPVVFSGRNVTRATLNNYENAEHFKLHKGDKIVIKLANDVIPFFADCLTKHKDISKDLVPTVCPSCKSTLVVVGIHLKCTNKKCNEILIQKIVHFCKSAEIEFFSEASIRALFNAKKIQSPNDLYKLTVKDFVGVEGFATSKTKNALEQIEKSKDCTVGELMDRCGAELIGVKAIKKLGIANVGSLWAFNDTKFVIGQNLITYLKENKDSMKELISFMRIKEEKVVEGGGRKVVCTGFRPHAPKEFTIIEKNGDNIVDTLNKDTGLLLVKDISKTSSKTEKAKKLGIEVKSYEQYFKA